MSKNEILDHLKKQNSELSTNTIITYASVLNSFVKKNELKRLWMIDLIGGKQTKAINSLPLKARKVLLSALLLYFKNDDSRAAKGEKEMWRIMMIDSKNEDKQNEEKQELTANQKENWMDWKDILKKRDELIYIPTGTKWSRKEINKFQDYLISALYTYNAPRRAQDYATMIMTKGSPKDNFIHWNTQEFIFNDYKTKKVYHTQKIKIADELFALLKLWKKHNKNGVLLEDTHGNPMTAKKLSNRLGSIFGKTGFGVNILRHSYVTDNLKGMPFLDKIKDIATDLGHSSNETVLYKKKV
jgi:integrase